MSNLSPIPEDEKAQPTPVDVSKEQSLTGLLSAAGSQVLNDVKNVENKVTQVIDRTTDQFKELFYAQAAQELEKLCQFTYNQAQGSSTFYSDLRALASKVHSLLALLAAKRAPVN